LFFQDGNAPISVGFGAQDVNGESFDGYVATQGGYNDCVMRIAVENVKPKQYSLLGSFMVSKYNCQDYCSDLRREYFRLIFNNSVRKKCCVGKKK
jgi:hypothetical protein